MSRHAAPLLILTLLSLAACGDCPPDAPVLNDAHHVPLVGQPNFRDLGGYTGAEGRTVKRGVIYRSGELNQLTDADVADLERRGIKTVVDFRSEYEVETRGADRLPAGARYLPLRIDSGDLATVLTKALESGDTSQLPAGVLADANRAIIRDATTQYAALFQALADPDGLPLVFHCTHGKDRAGVAAAVVLMALGVPAETARADYLLSNVYRKEQNDGELSRIRQALAKQAGVSAEELDLSKLEQLFWLEDAYFDAMLSEIESRYGSFEGYLEQGLGMTTEKLNALRDRLTE